MPVLGSVGSIGSVRKPEPPITNPVAEVDRVGGSPGWRRDAATEGTEGTEVNFRLSAIRACMRVNARFGFRWFHWLRSQARPPDNKPRCFLILLESLRELRSEVTGAD